MKRLDKDDFVQPLFDTIKTMAVYVNDIYASTQTKKAVLFNAKEEILILSSYLLGLKIISLAEYNELNQRIKALKVEDK